MTVKQQIQSLVHFNKYSIVLIFSLIIALADYQIARLAERLFSTLFPNISYPWLLSALWLAVAVFPFLLDFKTDGFLINTNQIRKNIKPLAIYFLFVLIGLAIFAAFGITKYFHSVKYPFVFFIITPIVEELIFRGWLYDKLSNVKIPSPVLSTAMLFGLHHLQYFSFKPTPFAIFQVTYTFLLGLLFGKMRQKSGNIYLSLISHILINYLTLAL